MQTVTNLGEIGTTAGSVRPLDWTLLRAGVAWNLTGYTSPTLHVRDLRTKTAVATNGIVSVTDAANGVVRYTPGASDPFYATGSGQYEAWVTAIPSGGGDPEPSGLFRYSIRAA